MGGKFRQGPKIAEFAHRVLTPDKVYVEPFCGALGAASRVAHNRMILNDICKPLILLWKGLYEGTITLPDSVTEEEYNEYKRKKDMDDPLTAFVGFGLAFGGKWFGTYARKNRGSTDPTQYCRTSKNSLIKRVGIIKECDVKFVNGSYFDLRVPRNSVVYCDPPYEKRTKAHAYEGQFCWDTYWTWVRSLVFDRGIPVLITAFTETMPDDFHILHSWGDTVVRHHAGKGSDGTNEVLACHRTQAKLFKK